MIPEYKVTSNPEKPYVLLKDLVYYSERYNNFISLNKGYRSDGASGPALDIHSASWWVHDRICDDPRFDDRTPITAFQASMVLADILRSEGRWFRALYWQASTFLFGCKKTRKNGWF